MPNHDWQAGVPLENRAQWTLPQFAGVLGRDATYVYDRLRWNDSNTAGLITLPGGIRVPARKDANGDGVVYRREFEAAVEAAPPVEVIHLAEEAQP